MITAAIPKLPFIDKQATIDYYCTQLGFVLANDYGDYFLIEKDAAEIHFFAYPGLQPNKSDFMIYLRMEAGIHEYYQQLQRQLVAIHPNAALEQKPWQQWEFSLLDPNGTLLTFGQSVD
jgi:hypothetical protein